MSRRSGRAWRTVEQASYHRLVLDRRQRPVQPEGAELAARFRRPYPAGGRATMFQRARRAIQRAAGSLWPDGPPRAELPHSEPPRTEPPGAELETAVSEPTDQSVERLLGQLAALRDGRPDLDVRVASIRALAQVAVRSDAHRPTIVSALSAYARQHARGGRPEDSRRLVVRPRLDVYEVFSAFGQLRRDLGAAIVPNLAGIDLSEMLLTANHLGGAILRGANLQGADLDVRVPSPRSFRSARSSLRSG